MNKAERGGGGELLYTNCINTAFNNSFSRKNTKEINMYATEKERKHHN
jgi:hypothetical protein